MNSLFIFPCRRATFLVAGFGSDLGALFPKRRELDAMKAFSTFAVCIPLAGLSDAASIVISEPAIPRSYEGFTAQVTFDAPYCVSAAYPLIGEGELRADRFRSR